jgi:hypothetical protein
MMDYVSSDNYILTKANSKHGYYFKLKVGNKFESGFRSICGNDCLTINYGRYTFVQNGYLIFQIDSAFKRNCKDHNRDPLAPSKVNGPYKLIQANNEQLWLVNQETKSTFEEIREVEKQLDSLSIYFLGASMKLVYYSCEAKIEKDWVKSLFNIYDIPNYKDPEIIFSKTYNHGGTQNRILWVESDDEVYFVIYNLWKNKIGLLKDFKI